MQSTNIHFYFSRKDSIDVIVSFHKHKCYELVYYYTGEGICEYGKVKYPYQANTYMIIPPDTLHNDIHTRPCKIFCLGFSSAKNDLPCGIFSDKDKKILNYINLISDEFKNAFDDHLAAVNSLISNIIIETKRKKYSKTKDFGNNLSLKNVIAYIDNNFTNNISPEDFAKISNYSYSRFRHMFKHAVGVSPKQYILNKRIELAKNLLTSTKISITSIAYSCGFTSSSIFTKQFIKNTDITPSRYRKQLHSSLVFTDTQSSYTKKNTDAE